MDEKILQKSKKKLKQEAQFDIMKADMCLFYPQHFIKELSVLSGKDREKHIL